MSNDLKYATMLEQTMPDGITRKLECRQAFDLRAPEPAKNYGIGSLDFWWVVKRRDCAVTWRMFTGWYLKEFRKGERHEIGMGSIDYHSPVELYEGQSSGSRMCEHIGCQCFSDGTSLTDTEFETFLVDPDSLWRELEQRLRDLEERVLTVRENAKSL